MREELRRKEKSEDESEKNGKIVRERGEEKEKKRRMKEQRERKEKSGEKGRKIRKGVRERRDVS